ncbi:hypothetical protein SPRG_20475 [Saprolegnia parasitica CBS 223.65]|uniref:AMP-dependent synthetase/ligase domain-containing protein n=1 Tax=Saprolegnia parasitica (strain CBS 223.65) TaxID=695850 RepID=A0A067CJI6_SAPPC|nr:hypothetical protein SPRG_20475 [Saprolegnia parasitica CBS 223.65]KDO26671.1 hypothetical protein SPRG_20475 [Saprolegnia parasitica CBS 223.65]|eukprot:XP_012202569.1 hypothetical protein SPRG_20475 [Saprolegnia parasitica CBS 223.65]
MATTKSRRSSKLPTPMPPPPRTLWSAFMEAVEASASAAAITRWPTNAASPGSYSWLEYAGQAADFARSFVAMDLARNDAVLFQMTAHPTACTFINMGVIGAGALVCHWRVQLQEVQSMWHSFPGFKWIVTDAAPLLPDYALLPHLAGIVYVGSSRTVLPSTDVPTYSVDQFLELGKLHPDASLEALQQLVRPNDDCLVSYQYAPDGHLVQYVLTHDNILFTAAQLAEGLQIDVGPTDRIIAYLPLHFVSSQVIEWYLSIAVGGGPVLYCVEGDASPSTLKQIQPTLFFGTPATWTALGRQLVTIKAQAHSVLYAWAKTRAVHHAAKLQVGGPRSKAKPSLGHSLANKLVLASMKKKLGLDSCRFCGVVLAKLAFDKIELFSTADLPLYQLDGSVETSGVASVNAPNAWALGSSGKPLPGTIISLAESPSGTEYQLCYKGRNVCNHIRGADNAWHSYQYGGLNPVGYVVINHHKEFIILASGDRIPPAPYEALLLRRAPYLQRAVVVGDGHTYLTVLLVLKTKKDKLVDEAIEKGRTLGSKALTIAEVLRCPIWAVALDQLLEQVNQAPLATLGDAAGTPFGLVAVFPLRKWLLLPADLGPPELSPDGDVVHRHVVANKYEKLIETLY